MKELRVIIAGSRDFSDYELLKKSAIEIITKKTMLPDLRDSFMHLAIPLTGTEKSTRQIRDIITGPSGSF